MRIVYVEDNVTNIALLERICQRNKDELITYLDADTALSGIEPGVSDLIIVDLHLGNYSINGLDLTRLLRERGITEPIVAVTSYDHLYAAYYQDAGCDAYLKKPISVGNMLDLIDRFRP